MIYGLILAVFALWLFRFAFRLHALNKTQNDFYKQLRRKR